MRYEEHFDIIKILTEETWQARKKMLDYMKTVQIEENTPSNEPVVEQNLNGSLKPQYPEYTGPVVWDPKLEG